MLSSLGKTLLNRISCEDKNKNSYIDLRDFFDLCIPVVGNVSYGVYVKHTLYIMERRCYKFLKMGNSVKIQYIWIRHFLFCLYLLNKGKNYLIHVLHKMNLTLCLQSH